MARGNQDRFKPAAVLALGLMLVIATGAYAEDPPFSGKWKGESRAAAPAGGAAAPGAAPGGAPGAGAPTAAPAGAPGGGAPGGGAPGGGGRAGGGGGGRGGGFGGGGGGAQKATLNLKQSKDNKISGNLTIGEAEPLDVKEGKVDGNTITFKVGRSGQPLTEYKGELKGDELTLTRQGSAPAPGGPPAGGPGGGRGGFGGGGGGATTFVLTKK